MNDAAGTVQIALTQIAQVLEPLQSELAPGRARATLAQLGIVLSAAQESSIAAPLAATVADVHDLMQLVGDLLAAIDADETSTIVSKSLGIVEKLVNAIQSLDVVTNGVRALGTIPPATANAIPERLFNYLLVRAIETAPGVNELLELLGILQRQPFNAGSTDPNNPPYSIATFHWGRIGDWFESPAEVLRSLYQWDDPAFDGVLLLQRLGALFRALGAPAFFDGSTVPPSLDLLVLELTPKTDVNPKGIAIGLNSDISTGPLTFGADDWQALITLGFRLPISSLLTITPAGVTFKPPTATGTYAGDLAIKLIADRSAAASGYILIGEPSGSRLEVRRAELDIGAGFTWNGDHAGGQFSVGGAVAGGKLLVSFSEADGFLGELLGGVHLESNFDFGIGYSTDHGLYFTGSSTLEIQLPLHLDLGPVAIDALTFVVGIQGQKFPTAIAVDVRAELGPIQAVVEQVGIEIDFSLKDDRSGNAGPVDVSVGFKPPRGAGLSIDTGLVVGGGYLFFDPEKGEYGGVAELSIAEIVTVKAIGLITTKMPDGSDGFSLLVIISAEFTPIQLGFGFTLNGVGGLLGLNRAVLLDVLRDGVRTGAIDSIMFPTDIVANAPRIISDLKAVFPPQQGTFLVGPMAKVGWASLVTLSLGVIIEIPPGNIAILGVLKVALPTEDEALIKIQVNFVGVLDFDKKMLSFDASLFDSHILFITLEGDMAVRLKWGDNAGFLLSVGGFHPAFTPPPLDLPTLRRLTIKILDYDWAKISVDGYFAVTSNTVQFGAHLHLFFGFDACNVSGELGLDVLFQFSPFYFNAALSGSLGIKVFGVGLMSIDLNFMLEGPTPWRARGTGSIGFLFFSIDVDFDVTWGDAVNTTLPPVAILPLLLGEVNKLENWKALPPPASNLLVSLRKLDPALMVLHPYGALALTQRALPLGLTLDKLGSQAPSDVNWLELTSAISGPTPLALNPTEEQFAAAQYLNMSDAEKLSRPSYQSFKGGATIGAADGAIESSKMTRRKIEYEQVIIDKEPVHRVPKMRAFGGMFEGLLNGASVAKSALSQSQKSLLQPNDGKVAVTSEGFTVAHTRDNKPLDAQSSFTSEAMAVDYLRERQRSEPSLDGALHVLPNHEVNQP
jgi:hypothetical protein